MVCHKDLCTEDPPPSNTKIDNFLVQVKRRKCGPKSSRPHPQRRPCNTFSCEFSWASAEWEECTASCGTTGTSYGEVFCLPSHQERNNTRLWDNMVDVNKCRDEQKPVQVGLAKI